MIAEDDRRRAVTRRVPIFATIVVAVAVVTMIALGLWQLQRRAEKETVLSRYAQAVTMNSDVPWPNTVEDGARALYRHTRIACIRVDGIEAHAGRSIDGRPGWAHIARCALGGGGKADVALGWSERPQAPVWSGGDVGGIIGPAGRGIRLVASPAVAGLAQLAAPDPANIPNNHLSYAVQWFAFAATAVVIYILALRRRGRVD